MPALHETSRRARHAESAKVVLAHLPGYNTLAQGVKRVDDQFAYRFNTDEKTTVAALAQFHRGIWYAVFATSHASIIDLFHAPKFKTIPACAIVRPGELLAHVPSPPLPPRPVRP